MTKNSSSLPPEVKERIAREVEGAVEFKFDPDTSITSEEEAFLKTLTPADIEKVRQLKIDNLFKERVRVIAVRSEDLIYLLRCIKEGYIPTKSFHLTGKYTEEESDQFLYATYNPDSDYIKEHESELVAHVSSRGFESTAKDVFLGNLRLYAKIAKKQAIWRNLMPLVKDRAAMEKDLVKLGIADSYGQVEWEDFFDDLIRHGGGRGMTDQDCGWSTFRNPFNFLFSHLKEGTYDKEDMRAFMNTLEERGGVMIGLDNRTAEDYEYISDARDTRVHGFDEIVFKIPDGKLPLDMLVGFEVLGEFEDDVLERLGIE